MSSTSLSSPPSSSSFDSPSSSLSSSQPPSSSPPPSSPPSSSTWTWMVGVMVKIKTLLGEEIEGQIFTFDTNSNCPFLLFTQEETSQSQTSSSHQNIRILRTNFVKEVSVISAPPTLPTPAPLPTLPPINIALVRARGQQALRQAHADATRIGVGVSSEAQEIFNSLCKTLPCRWHNDTIIVFEDVRISRPYGLEHVTGSDLAEINRVKKVLEGERRKLGYR